MIASAEALADIMTKHQQDRLVLIHGVYDVFHVGHLRHLEVAKSLGVVCVGVWGDEHVKARKGPGRPLNTIESRLQVIDAFEAVDYVFAAEGVGTPEASMWPYLQDLRPDLYMVSSRKHPSFDGAGVLTYPDGSFTSMIYDVTYAEKSQSSTNLIDRARALVEGELQSSIPQARQP